MLKLMIAGKRPPGKTREEALRHLRDVHGPMVYDAPDDAGAMPAHYVQNHVFDGPRNAALAPFLGERDLVTEVWFDDFDGLRASTATPYYRDHLQPDETNFVDQETVLKAVTVETDERGERPAAAVKLFLFLKCRPDPSPKPFEAVAAALADLADDPHVAASVVNRSLPPPGGGEPFAEKIAEFWFRDRQAAEAFCEAKLGAAMAGSLAPLIDPAGSFYVLADEYPPTRLRAERAKAQGA